MAATSRTQRPAVPIDDDGAALGVAARDVPVHGALNACRRAHARPSTEARTHLASSVALSQYSLVLWSVLLHVNPFFAIALREER